MKSLTKISGVNKLSFGFKEWIKNWIKNWIESLKDSKIISDIQKATRSLFMVSSLALWSIWLTWCGWWGWWDWLSAEAAPVWVSKTTSRFIDGDVEWLTVIDEHWNVSLTDENGTFSIDKWWSVTFSVWNVDIWSIDQNEITWEDSFLHNLLWITAEESINNPRASAIARFLQTIDYDSDHSNWIQITKETRDILANYLTWSGKKLDFETTDVNNLEQELNYIAAIVWKALVSKWDAIKNFTDILMSYGIITKEYVVNNTSGIYVTKDTWLLDDTTTPTVETNTTTPTVETIDYTTPIKLKWEPFYNEKGEFVTIYKWVPWSIVKIFWNQPDSSRVFDENWEFSEELSQAQVESASTWFYYFEMTQENSLWQESDPIETELEIWYDENGKKVVLNFKIK